jgi:hypothetical protein
VAIYVTGDMHGGVDIRKLNEFHFPQQKSLTKGDYLIVLGDFGCVWSGEEKDYYWLDWLENKPFTTLFVDGNHENFPLLYQYPEEEWCGGRVHKVRPSVIHLMRGQMFEIEGYTFFTMGGATSIDREYRKEGVSWWPQEQPSEEEYEEALVNLEKYSYEVDVVLTHTTSIKRMVEMDYVKEMADINVFLDEIVEDRLKFRVWYFGHFHEERNMDCGRVRVRYNSIERLGIGVL